MGDEQLTFAVVRPPVRIPPHLRERPVAILGLCKEAALDADWRLSQWVEFRKTADACLSPGALPEEMSLFMKVVEERFSVSS